VASLRTTAARADAFPEVGRPGDGLEELADDAKAD
jgi:hypothetical protein